jgi:disulfide bond formation protein DsbB
VNGIRRIGERENSILKYREILISIIGVFLLVILIACGGNSTPPTEVPPTQNTPTPPAAANELTPTELISLGEEKFLSCVGCHGLDAKGLAGLGKDLVNSTFVQGLDDDELLAFIKTGRPPSDPLNTTGLDMPPKGGNPALSDTDIRGINAWLRSKQE